MEKGLVVRESDHLALIISYFVCTVVNPVWWIRISFNADPDPAFHLNADPNPGSQNNADPDQILSSLKVEFLPYFIGTRY